jgi:hypothetical protein
MVSRPAGCRSSSWETRCSGDSGQIAPVDVLKDRALPSSFDKQQRKQYQMNQKITKSHGQMTITCFDITVHSR